jgi:hypothetical protein
MVDMEYFTPKKITILEGTFYERDDYKRLAARL